MILPTSPAVDGVSAEPVFSGATLDGIAEALVRAPDARRRSSLVSALLSETYETAAWFLNGAGPGELQSLEQVVREARNHHARMTDIERSVDADGRCAG